MPKLVQSVFILVLALAAAASMWFFVDYIFKPVQLADAALHQRPRGNLSDLYPRWLGARELLLHGRNPYSAEITREIQTGYYGRPIDPSRPDDPKDEQRFAYPVYVVFLLAPTVRLSFEQAQTGFRWLLVLLSAGSVVLWLRALRWKASLQTTALCVILMLWSLPGVQAIRLQQLTLLVAALLAGCCACLASGWLFCGGALLALATIKPQLAWPMVAWLLVWAAWDWRVRRGFLFGFVLTTTVLLGGAEILLPGWLWMFLDGVREYSRYTQAQSVLDLLANWAIGPYGGRILAAIATVISAVLLWKCLPQGKELESSGGTVALVLALTVMIVPMYAPYNQVLLVPAILWLARESKGLIANSFTIRLLGGVGILTLTWPWLAAVGLSAAYLLGFRTQALSHWQSPFYATFALPGIVFLLMALGLFRQHPALRRAAPQSSLER